jgi:hypothetical protein
MPVSYLRTSRSSQRSFPRRSQGRPPAAYVWVHCATSAIAAQGGKLAVQLPRSVERILHLLRVDFAPVARPPSAASLLAATVASVVGSLAADALLVVIGQAVFPATRGYAHFQFGDYSKLTVIGVVIACLAWPVVTRISSAPRWLFLRMAVAVTLVLWIPDVYILGQGQPPRAVAVLFLMHLAIAVVTYGCLVCIARTRPVVLVPEAEATVRG